MLRDRRTTMDAVCEHSDRIRALLSDQAIHTILPWLTGIVSTIDQMDISMRQSAKLVTMFNGKQLAILLCIDR